MGVRWEGDGLGKVVKLDWVSYGYRKRGLECKMRPIAGREERSKAGSWGKR